MAARTNKRDPRAARTLRRISFVREVKQSFLIICEGVNTEPDYFNAFRLTSANIKAVGQGLNTVGKDASMTSAGWYLTRMTFPIGISTGLSVWRKPVA